MDNQIQLLMSIVKDSQARIRQQAQVEHAIGQAALPSKAPLAQSLAKTVQSSRDTRPSYATGRP